MALQLVAGHAINAANNAGMDLGGIIAARDVAGFSANSGAFVARDDSGPSSVNIFIDANDSDNEYAASVVAACESQTVYAIQCTAGSDAACGSDTPPVTVTENASSYRVSSAVTTTTGGVEVKATIVEECDLAGTTRATCTATLAGEAQGQKYSTSSVLTYTQAATLHFDVPVTAGNEKLANPTGTCSNGASGLSARAVALWGLLGAVGAVGVLAL